MISAYVLMSYFHYKILIYRIGLQSILFNTENHLKRREDNHLPTTTTPLIRMSFMNSPSTYEYYSLWIHSRTDMPTAAILHSRIFLPFCNLTTIYSNFTRYSPADFCKHAQMKSSRQKLNRSIHRNEIFGRCYHFPLQQPTANFSAGQKQAPIPLRTCSL